jgi:NAD(P)-dependent dehydrogenase (short-subunit alcohol dehydrogenase family)
MDLGLKSQVAIVTGGAKGIGAAIVEGFVKERSHVVVADYSIDDAQKLAEKLGKDGVKVLAIRTDVTKKSDVDNLASVTLQEFGKIDILVNNAGIISDIKFIDLEEKEWNRVNDINAKGVYLVTQAVVPQMMAAKRGKIINLSSLAGKKGAPRVAHYCASKFAVIGITQSLAYELAEYNINVNAVCPGILRTALWEGLLDTRSKSQNVPREQIWDRFIEQVPLKRPQTPEDIANIILFLSSEVSKNITGEAISVNGGIRMD